MEKKWSNLYLCTKIFIDKLLVNLPNLDFILPKSIKVYLIININRVIPVFSQQELHLNV